MFVNKNIFWTEHSKIKMRQYCLSESRVMRVLRHPKRLEVGVTPNTTAGMQAAGSKKHPYEIWVMWVNKLKNQKAKIKNDAKRHPERSEGSKIITVVRAKEITIISAWKYPGVSPIHEPPPIPEEVWEIVRKNIDSHA